MNILAYLKRRLVWQKRRAIYAIRTTLILIFCATGFLRCEFPTAAAQVSEASRGTAASAATTPAHSPAASSGSSPHPASDNPQTNPAADTIGVIEGDAIA